LSVERKAFFFTHNRSHRRSNLRYHRKYIKNLHSCAYLLADNTGESRMNNAYLSVISLIERLHRQFLEVVKLELDGMGIRDINNVQAMVLFNIGDAEMTVGELTLRGCYLGSNVSYNIKKMVEQGYLSQTRSVHDRRSAHVRLSEKGRQLRESLIAMHRRHVNMLRDAAIGADDLRVAEMTLRQLGQFWSHTSDLAQRSPLAAGLPQLMHQQ
jgi:DNA-binding MarR family transcriptional regulator